MEHPCNKKCLKYPVCINQHTITCSNLNKYYFYLKELFSYKYDGVGLQHIHVWKEIKINLPNIIGIRNAHNI